MDRLPSTGATGLLIVVIVTASLALSALQVAGLVIGLLIAGLRLIRTSDLMLGVGACAVCLFILLPSGAQAGLSPEEKEPAAPSKIDPSTGALSHVMRVGLKKQPARAARPKAPSSTESTKGRSPTKAEDSKETASSRDRSAAESEEAVLGEAESGVEYFCHQPRKRLWVQDRGVGRPPGHILLLTDAER